MPPAFILGGICSAWSWNEHHRGPLPRSVGALQEAEDKPPEVEEVKEVQMDAEVEPRRYVSSQWTE